jgi:hypothetical protein
MKHSFTIQHHMNAMKLWISLFLIAFSLPCLHAQYRSFTNQDGQTITAVVLDKTHDSVTLRTKDRKKYDYPIAKLSPEDQKFLANWSPGIDGRELPTYISQRCSKEDRAARLAAAGGNEQTEEAVLKALRWMKSTQAPDGSWGSTDRAAMTGLGLLAYLGHCETPLSEEFGESCLIAMAYLINLGMKNDGKLAEITTDKSWPYEHAIAVQALAESTAFCQKLNITVPNLKEVTQKAGQFLIDNQHPNGGWAYLYEKEETAHTDMSITGWHLHALKSMEQTDLEFANLAICATKGLKFAKSLQSGDGEFGYRSMIPLNGMRYFTLTGAGVSCFQLWDGGSDKIVKNGIQYIIANTKLKWGEPECDLYGHYFESMALRMHGGEAWETYNRLMRDEILRNQNPNGIWKIPEGKLRAVAPIYQTNEFYRTVLCTLILEVYHRYQPIAP